MSLQRGRKQRRLWGPIRQTGATNWERETAQMANGFLMRHLWRVLDALDYWLTQARLWTVDALCTTLPLTGRITMMGLIASNRKKLTVGVPS
jgi:hypothetical protein